MIVFEVFRRKRSDAAMPLHVACAGDAAIRRGAQLMGTRLPRGMTHWILTGVRSVVAAWALKNAGWWPVRGTRDAWAWAAN